MATKNTSISSMLSFLPPRYRPYGIPVAAASLVFVAVAVTVSNFLEQRRDNQIERVSALFWDMSDKLAEGDIDGAETSFTSINEEGDGGQKTIAALRIGSGYYAADDFEGAKKAFTEVIASAEEESMRDIGRIRLAKSLMATNEYEEATDMLLSIETSSEYITIVSELLIGDINLAKENLDEADFAYSEAMAEAIQTGDQVLLNIISAKRDALASIRLQQGLPLKATESPQQ